ncbi:hypothetical protein L0E00_27485, partial [Klebsiella pneumoniae]|nr:hypothetical protein [Klebsiella pneumoniae]
KEFLPRSIPMSAMFSMIVLRMKAYPQHSTGKEGVTISLNILSAVLTLREVIITSTTTTQVAPKSNMKLGANTSAVQNSGVKTPVQKNESILSRLSGFVAGG